MQQRFFDQIEAALSSERLSPYGRDNPGPGVVMGRYLWNVAICQSLYAPLQFCEVALRNAIHAAMTALYSPTWFDTANLTAWGYQQIGNAKTKIAKTGNPVTPGRVVAELHFGFWTSLFEDHYERNTKFLPGGIKKVFPGMPHSLHNRKNIKARLERIRQLRNRVFHHERIVHWTDLTDQHARIIETIRWISPEIFDLVLKLDRFLDTHRAGVNPWIVQIRSHWPADPGQAAELKFDWLFGFQVP